MADPALVGVGDAADPIEPLADGERPGRAWRRGAARNATANGVARIVSIGTSFVLTPLILTAVGTDAYGLWVLIGSIVAYASLLDLGIGGAVTKYVAEHRARDETTAARAVIGTGLRLYLALGAAIALIGVVISPLIPQWLGVPPDLAGTATATTAAMSIGLGIAIPCTTATAVLRGLQRYDVAASISIVGSLLSAGLTLVALALGWGIVGIVVVGIPIPVITQALAFAAVRRVAPDLTTGPRPTVPGTARRIFGFSWPLFLLDVAGRLQAKSDEIVVGVVLSLGAVTPYALGRKLAAIPRLLAEQFAMVLLPRASELDAAAEHARLRSLYLGGVRVSLGLAMPLTVCLVLLAGPILDVWVGPGFDDGAPVVGILAIAAIVDLSLWPAGFVLQGIARHRWLGPISMGSGIANLVLSIALAPTLGIVGVAIGTLIPALVEAVVVLTPYTLRTLGLGPRRFLGEALAPAVLPVIPAVIAIRLVEQVIAPDSILALVVTVAAAHAAYLAPYLLFPSAAPERRLVRDLIGGRRAR